MEGVEEQKKIGKVKGVEEKNWKGRRSRGTKNWNTERLKE